MKKVKAGEVRFLVSTDVAARGIDISDLSHVVNYSLPQDASVYLHRTGRTGRIGKSGRAISLVGGTDLQTRKALETWHGIKFVVKELPDADTAVRYRMERQARQIRDAMGSLVFEAYLPTVRALKERPDGEALLAAALRAFFQWDRQRRAAMSDVDSIGDLIQQRNEKLDRKAAARKDRGGDRGDRRSGDRDRGDRGDRGGDRGDRGGRRRERGSADVAELDALLVSTEGAKNEADKPKGDLEEALDDVLEAALTSGGAPSADGDADGERKKKRRRRRRRKGEAGENGVTAESGTGDTTEGAGEGDGRLDDLDSLLTSG
jgi:ATP-dependent RNA helicase DeaD